MIKRWHWKAFFFCLGIIVLAVGVICLVQHLSEEPEERSLSHEVPVAASTPGRVLLSLSSSAVTVKAGPPGGPILVEANFDPDIYRLEQQYQRENDGGWTYRLDFHERSVLHISVISIWLGKRSPEVSILIPADLPLDLEAKMEGGYLAIDLAGLVLATTTVELDRGVLGMTVSEPLSVPMERLSVKGRIGAMQLLSLGNASPRALDVQHGIGAAQVHLGGPWRTDADIDFRIAFGNGELRLPTGVRIEGLDQPLESIPEQEIPPPTLRISTHFDMGDIRVTD